MAKPSKTDRCFRLRCQNTSKIYNVERCSSFHSRGTVSSVHTAARHMASSPAGRDCPKTKCHQLLRPEHEEDSLQRRGYNHYFLDSAISVEQVCPSMTCQADVANLQIASPVFSCPARSSIHTQTGSITFYKLCLYSTLF